MVRIQSEVYAMAFMSTTCRSLSVQEMKVRIDLFLIRYGVWFGPERLAYYLTAGRSTCTEWPLKKLFTHAASTFRWYNLINPILALLQIYALRVSQDSIKTWTLHLHEELGSCRLEHCPHPAVPSIACSRRATRAALYVCNWSLLGINESNFLS